VAEAAMLLKAAKNIVMLIGRTSRSEAAWNARVKLAETIGAKVITCLKVGACFPTDHPLHLGAPSVLTPDANGLAALAKADLILSLDWVDLAGTLKAAGAPAPGAKVISVTVDYQTHNGWSMDHQGLAPVDVLLAADPEIGAAHGTMLVGALTGAGEFEAAFQFADAAPAELREEWLASAFRRWAAQKPGAAVKALDSIEDESLRQPLFRSLAEGWAERDPAALTAYTLAQAPSPNRDQVLAVAMLKWGEQDPAAMALWLNTLPRGLDFDVGTAVLVMRTDQANRSVDVALHWVESISTTELRHDSLVHVLAEWEQTDPVSARAYLERVSWLTSDERAVIRVELKHSGRDPPETQDRSPQL